MNDIKLLSFHNIILGEVISRPSKRCRSPYVADVILKTNQPNLQKCHENSKTFMAHSPSLGCCGLISPGKTVLMKKLELKNGRKCVYSILAYLHEDGTIVGTHPQHGNQIWNVILKSFPNIYYKILGTLNNIISEISITNYNSRFDFSAYRTLNNNKNKIIMEVKSVPIASCNVLKTSRYSYDCGMKYKSQRISFFPDGYRKKKGDVISPRALRQIREMYDISKKNIAECYVVYIIPRNDTSKFAISPHDPIYKNETDKCKNENHVKQIIVRCRYDYNFEKKELNIYFRSIHN
jgi:DNA-binding sugar fermentation-stimulating protein